MNYIIFHSDFSKRAGTERVLYNLISHLSRDDSNNVTLLVTTKPKPLVFGIDKLPIKIQYLNIPDTTGGRLSLLFFYITLFFRSRAFFRTTSQTSQTVILSSNHLLAACAYYATRKRGAFRNISCEHFSFHVSGTFSRWLRKRFYPNITVVTLTEGDRQLIDEALSPKRCVCIPNAIPFRSSPYRGGGVRG